MNHPLDYTDDIDNNNMFQEITRLNVKIVRLINKITELRKFEADALPVLDAYEHMHTRAVRAEAEIERMEDTIVGLAEDAAGASI